MDSYLFTEDSIFEFDKTGVNTNRFNYENFLLMKRQPGEGTNSLSLWIAYFVDKI